MTEKKSLEIQELKDIQEVSHEAVTSCHEVEKQNCHESTPKRKYPERFKDDASGTDKMTIPKLSCPDQEGRKCQVPVLQLRTNR